MLKSYILKNKYIVWLIATFCCLLWGSAFPMIKLGYANLNIISSDTSTIILFAGIRFFLAGILTIVIFSFIEKKALIPQKNDFSNICVLSLFQTVLQYLFFYLGLAFTTGTKASVINGTSVFIAFLISAILFKQEKVTFNKTIGCLVGFVGVVIAGLFGGNEKLSLQIGDLFILLSAISYSFSSVFMKKYSKNSNPAMLSGYQFVLGGFVMIIVGLIFGGRINFNFKGVGIIVYLAFLSAIAYSLWSILLKYNDVSKIAVCGSMTPIFGFLLSLILLGETNGSLIYNLIGLIFVAVGIIFVNIKNKVWYFYHTFCIINIFDILQLLICRKSHCIYVHCDL